MSILAYTDGACKGNGKNGDALGGYGASIRYPNGDIHNLWAGESNTTNNRMEILGAILAIKNTPADQPLMIFTDSNYVVNTMTKWLAGWKKNGWKKKNNQPLENLDLWQQMDTLCQNRVINWQWVKGHDGNDGNETADRLANMGVHGSGDEYISSAHQGSLSDFPAHQPPVQQEHAFGEFDSPNFENHQFMDNQITNLASTPSGFARYDGQNPAYDGDTSRRNPDFWAVIPNPINRDKPERQLIMDTETTGLHPDKGDRIVEVGIIEMVGRKFTGVQLHVYLNPDKIMDEEVIKVHGISNEFLSDKPRFDDVAVYLYEFMKGSELIAHNASFDMGFLEMEFKRAGIDDFLDTVAVTDSLAMARRLFSGQKNSLDALVRRLNVTQRDRTFHGALLDSEILAEVYLAMTSGQMTLNMEDDSTETQETQAITFNDLSFLASRLLTSKHDHDADLLWRQTMIKS